MKINENDLWLNWGEIVARANNRRIILFGRGEWMAKTRPYLPTDAAYVVDNNKYEQGCEESGLKIYSPEKLKTENLEEIFVIITNTGFPLVIEQLSEYGLKAGRHYCVTPSLKSYRTISRVTGHQQSLYLTCSDFERATSAVGGGGLHRLEIPSGKMTTIIKGNCHGMAEGQDAFFLVDDEVGIRVLNHDLTERSQFSLPPKSRPHGITYCPKRDLIVVCLSGRDSLGIFDGKTYQMVAEVYISDKYQKGGLPQHHVNDPHVFGDSLFVSMFSFSGNWKIGVYDGGILEIDLDTKKIRGPVVSNLWMPHTPTMINGSLHYCDSMRGRVQNTTWKTITQFNGFVRGIAWDGQFYYVGQSMHRYIDRAEGALTNISLDTGVFLVDPHSKATKFFTTPGVNDLNTVFLPRNRQTAPRPSQ